MQNGPKAVWGIPDVSVASFASLKQNYIAYRSSKVSWRPDCIFEIHQLWQSGFRRVYTNCCCSCFFESVIIKIGQSSHKMYSNNIGNCQESTKILNARTKKSGNLSYAPRISLSTSRSNPTGKLLIIGGFYCRYQKADGKICLCLDYFTELNQEVSTEAVSTVKSLLVTAAVVREAATCDYHKSLKTD